MIKTVTAAMGKRHPFCARGDLVAGTSRHQIPSESLNMPQASASDRNPDIILLAVLDLFEGPVWIADSDSQALVMNEKAREIAAQGFVLDDFMDGSQQVEVKGRPFFVRKNPMNHGTNFVLYELCDPSEAATRLRSSVALLTQKLEERSVLERK